MAITPQAGTPAQEKMSSATPGVKRILRLPRARITRYLQCAIRPAGLQANINADSRFLPSLRLSTHPVVRFALLAGVT